MVIELNRSGHGVGVGHVEALEDGVDVEGLREGKGASRAVAGDLHAKIMTKLAKVFAEKTLLESLLHRGEVSGILGNEDHIIHVDKDEEEGWRGADIEAGISSGRTETEVGEVGGEFSIPFERRLLEAVDGAAEVPDGARGEGVGKTGGALHEDAFAKVALEERVGDVHCVSFPVTMCGEIKEAADCGEFGGW